MKAEQARQLLLGALVYDPGGRQLLRAVHAHVQGRVERVAETSFGRIELEGADTEVEQSTCKLVNAEGIQDGVDMVETALHHGARDRMKLSASAPQPLLRRP